MDHHFGSAAAILATLQFLSGMVGSLVFATVDESTVLPLASGFTLTGIAMLIIHFAARKAEVARS